MATHAFACTRLHAPALTSSISGCTAPCAASSACAGVEAGLCVEGRQMSKAHSIDGRDRSSPADPPGREDLWRFLQRSVPVRPNAPARSIQNHLENRLYQLKGMLALTYGEGDELLQSLDPDLRQGFMWACAELLDEVILLAQRRSSRPAEDESRAPPPSPPARGAALVTAPLLPAPARIGSPSVRCFSGGVGFDQADANEALIADAPTLFVAAAEVFALIDEGFLTVGVLADDHPAAWPPAARQSMACGRCFLAFVRRSCRERPSLRSVGGFLAVRPGPAPAAYARDLADARARDLVPAGRQVVVYLDRWPVAPVTALGRRSAARPTCTPAASTGVTWQPCRCWW